MQKSPLYPASVPPNPFPRVAVNLDWPRFISAEEEKKQQALNVKVRRSVSHPEREPGMFSGVQEVTGILMPGGTRSQFKWEVSGMQSHL